MTNEELDKARVKEAQRLFLDGSDESPTILIAARLAREGWTPPEPVDPDLAEAIKMAQDYWSHGRTIKDIQDAYLYAIKRGRTLAAAETTPGMVWVKHDRSTRSPVSADTWVLVYDFGYQPYIVKARHVAWQSTSRYCVITIPE